MRTLGSSRREGYVVGEPTVLAREPRVSARHRCEPRTPPRARPLVTWGRTSVYPASRSVLLTAEASAARLRPLPPVGLLPPVAPPPGVAKAARRRRELAPHECASSSRATIQRALVGEAPVER